MPDLSTREQIRADAIDRIARVLFDADAADACSGDPYEHWAARYRRKAEPFVDALGDLLPAGIEWGAHLDGHASPSEALSKAEAQELCEFQGERVVRKYLHDWIEVTE